MPSLKSWITVIEQVISEVLGECYFPLPKRACFAFCVAMWVFPFPLLTACKEVNIKRGKEIADLERRTEAECSSYV